MLRCAYNCQRQLQTPQSQSASDLYSMKNRNAGSRSDAWVFLSAEDNDLKFILVQRLKFLFPYINKIQQDARVCKYLFTAKSVSTCFGCPSHPSSRDHKTVTAASGTGHSIWATTFLQRGLIRPRWRKFLAQKLWPVPESSVTVLCSPDDGCDGHPKHVETDFAVNKYLHTLASFWILLI